MDTRKQRGDGGLSLIAVVALVGLLGWGVPKLVPHVFDSRTKDADASIAATAEVKKAVADAVAGEQKKAAQVSASVQVMGEAAAEAGDSPWAVFVSREAAHVTPLLPAPDYKALYAAEARKRAVLEGKLELADKLYQRDAEDKQKLIDRVAKLQAKVDAGFQARAEVDLKLAEAAAEQRGKDFVIGILAIITVLAAALWLYARFSSLSPTDVARLANRVRSGWDPMEAIEATVPDWMHNGIHKVATKMLEKEAAEKAAAEARLKKLSDASTG